MPANSFKIDGEPVHSMEEFERQEGQTGWSHWVRSQYDVFNQLNQIHIDELTPKLIPTSIRVCQPTEFDRFCVKTLLRSA